MAACASGAVVKANIRDETGRDLEDHVLSLHREVTVY